MHLVKRLEVIASSVELPKILEALDKAGVTGYTVIPHVLGKSASGHTSDDIESNAYVLAFFQPDFAKPAVEALKPILNKFGGTCYVSDAMEIRSMRCVASL